MWVRRPRRPARVSAQSGHRIVDRARLFPGRYLAFAKFVNVCLRQLQGPCAAARVRGHTVIGVDQPFLSQIELHPATATPPCRFDKHGGIGRAFPHCVDFELYRDVTAQQSRLSPRAASSLMCTTLPENTFADCPNATAGEGKSPHEQAFVTPVEMRKQRPVKSTAVATRNAR